LVVRTDKTDYAVGETVNITVSFVSLIPGCVLPMIVDDYLVKVEVLNVANQTLYSSSHTTARSLNMSEPWTPTMAGEDTIVVSAYFRLPSDESVMWEILETSTEIHVHEPVQTTPAYDKAAAGALGVVVVVGLLFLRRRKKDYQREHAVLS
jgi:MYXO-CTERM domain-containing protein